MQGELSLEQRRRLADNLGKVRDQIATAAAKSGRRADEVKLVAVTKYVSTAVALALYDLGCADLGESRPQELWSKAEALSGCEVHWHLIGHLQKNKVRRTLPMVSLIQSVDQESLAEEIDKEAAKLERPISVLLEVNISGDAAKHGFAPAEVELILQARDRLPHLRFLGLMGMSGLNSNDQERRQQFAKLRQLRDRAASSLAFHNGSTGELSMGMSEDFAIAVEEGATMVRVGSALFEGVVD
jgi:PLP dependent protein